ncbi:exodeoxyribonuclease III [Acidiferrobacter sp. SPIII_3]|jgi:exodeoxyribonuclease-3|uniref:exodeoxyribonuclease III n=1 Tax=Acidiferrobacter sp. SPIII_3 TaxID=1281578 RepID=UPI000D728D0E|nr:exodeoxyribonuclease III [Acidiferrobacter sp. SPIII_3]AWP24638.1 exodeoxyribonuclease III [Acidiferrobacter sp. SPIII_3]
MKIATWNVNSLRVRLAQVEAWLDDVAPDILCLQETKVQDADFPIPTFMARGYEVVFHGQRTYNGVAIAARGPLSDITCGLADFADEQCRALAATFQGLRVASLYVPNGTAVDSPRYPYKLGWLAALKGQSRVWLAQNPALVLAGDFNIAPEDRDVYDPAVWEGSVLVSAPERAAFRALIDTGLTDALGSLAGEGRGFSWWDYRAAAFRRDQGLRIDHILLGPPLAATFVRGYVDRKARAHPRPSDHAPVVVELAWPPA